MFWVIHARIKVNLCYVKGLLAPFGRSVDNSYAIDYVGITNRWRTTSISMALQREWVVGDEYVYKYLPNNSALTVSVWQLRVAVIQMYMTRIKLETIKYVYISIYLYIQSNGAKYIGAYFEGFTLYWMLKHS